MGKGKKLLRKEENLKVKTAVKDAKKGIIPKAGYTSGAVVKKLKAVFSAVKTEKNAATLAKGSDNVAKIQLKDALGNVKAIKQQIRAQQRKLNKMNRGIQRKKEAVKGEERAKRDVTAKGAVPRKQRLRSQT